LRERIEEITSHLATVLRLLSGMASCFIRETGVAGFIIKNDFFAMLVRPAI
jgi:hypothetical protein